MRRGAREHVFALCGKLREKPSPKAKKMAGLAARQVASQP
jgi:hypothetical protein